MPAESRKVLARWTHMGVWREKGRPKIEVAAIVIDVVKLRFHESGRPARHVAN